MHETIFFRIDFSMYYYASYFQHISQNLYLNDEEIIMRSKLFLDNPTLDRIVITKGTHNLTRKIGYNLNSHTINNY